MVFRNKKIGKQTIKDALRVNLNADDFENTKSIVSVTRDI